MKYSTEIIIDLPRNRVLELFDSSENLVKWQKSLVSFEHLSGEAGQLGAKSKLIYEMGKREFILTETITKRNLPDEFHGTYETDGMYNLMENYFIDEGDKTLWRTVSTFKGTNFMMKLMLILMPGSFRKRTLNTMMDFKKFAEAQT